MNSLSAEKKRISLNWWVGLAATVAVCMFYAALVSFRTMPITEGWYTEYAWLINNGSLPYRDFEYLFFPLYMFIIAGFTSVFGYSILALRILGIFVFGGIGAALYCIFSKLFDNLSGMIAALVSAMFLQGEVGQLFYDYIRFHDLFALTSAYLLLRVCMNCKQERPAKSQNVRMFTGIFAHYAVPVAAAAVGLAGVLITPLGEHPRRWLLCLLVVCAGIGVVAVSVFRKKTNRTALAESAVPATAIACGIFAAAECMVKQSNGVLMIVMICVLLPYCTLVTKNKSFMRAFAGFLSGVVFAFLFLAAYLLATDTVGEFMRCCFGSALSAKGGLLQTLFGWILPTVRTAVLRDEILVVAAVIYIAAVFYLQNKDSMAQSYDWKALLVIAVLATCGAFVFVEVERVAAILNGRNDQFVPGLVFYPCTVAFCAFAVCFLIRRIKGQPLEGIWNMVFPMFPILGVIFAQGYGSGMSGGLASSQTCLAMGILTAFCLHAALKANARVMFVTCLALSFALTGTFISRKTIQTYDWWGLTQDNISYHTQKADVPLLEGISMREMDKRCYETVYNDVVNNTEEGDDIFVFPHAPVFYTITDRHSVTYSQVQWFDVSSMQTIENDIAALSENLPEMIVYVGLPDAVYEGHESGFSTYQTRRMRDFLLNELIPQYDYACLNTVDIGNGFTVSTYLRPQN